MSEVARLVPVSLKGVLSTLVWLCLCATLTYALGQKHYVEFAATPAALPLVAGGVALSILSVELWHGSDVGNTFPITNPRVFTPEVIFGSARFSERTTE